MDLQPFVTAFQAHQYVLLIALVVGALVATAKQGWFSTFVASKMPAAALPYYAVALGVLGSIATQVQQGVSLSQAVINGALAGVLAITGHEMVVESARSGKELVPARVVTPPGPPTPPSA